ncbi:putative flavohemoglobin [Clavulina sp. PMI_390]|nr:putative flavohemoglobin [Clavulina sp. PMI_390]
MLDFKTTPLPPRPSLSDDQKKLVFDSVPVLQAHGTKITEEMYKNMLGENSSLRDVFNHSKQASGAQQYALAQALEAYARNIYNLEPILPTIRSIANKHASLSIEPWMYNIVGHYLVDALSTVLPLQKVAFDGALKTAWIDAYWYLAHEFIGLEAGLYQSAGWLGWKPFKVVKRVPETSDIASFYLEPVDGTDLKAFKAGQYISVQLTVDELNCKQSRQYSLSDSSNSKYLRISVSRDPGARILTPSGSVDPSGGATHYPAFVSNLLHSKVFEGATIEVASPFGEFLLDDSTAPLVFISGGVGLTPLLSMLNTIAGTSKETALPRRVTWIQSVRKVSDLAFGQHIDNLVKTFPSSISTVTYYTGLKNGAPEVDAARTKTLAIAPSAHRQVFGGRIAFAPKVATADTDTSFDASVLYLGNKEAHYYICGPAPFMSEAQRQLEGLGVEAIRIHTEKFAGDKPAH